MPIKHLVIAGGGPIGLQYIGTLKYLNEEGFWNFDDIESIYATSIGTFIGACICLKYDWSTLINYVINRPWHDAFKLNGKQIFDAFYNKGLYDKKVIEIVFKPLLEAKDLSLNITLKEFYEYSKIEFYFYTFELNKFETTEISYKTHPDLLLMQAIHMSSALPGIFTPTCIGNECFIDGGVIDNYPLSYCLNAHPNPDEILGITFYRDLSKPDAYKNNIVTEESSVIEFSIGFFINAMNYIFRNEKKMNIENQVECANDNNFLTLEVIQKSLNSIDMRKEWIERGITDAKLFLEKRNKEPFIEPCVKIAP
jgi:predicted acylesterase/phospholipase RssA